eukprot:1455690-Alexandrium_andersonii.AAC.1
MVHKARRRVLSLPPEHQDALVERPGPRLHLLRWGSAHARAVAQQSRGAPGASLSEPPSPTQRPLSEDS